jgi:hypothetical protein
MKKIRTHYDNLKVVRDAPVEVIRAAYRTLAQKYHPDHSPSPDSERVMKLLNEAWSVLGDPVRRAEYDQWVQYQERDYEYSQTAFRSASPTAAANQEVKNNTGAAATKQGAGNNTKESATQHSSANDLSRSKKSFWYGPRKTYSSSETKGNEYSNHATSPRHGRKKAFGMVLGAGVLIAGMAGYSYITKPKPLSYYYEEPAARVDARPEQAVQVQPSQLPLSNSVWDIGPNGRAHQPALTGAQWPTPNGRPWPKGPAYLSGEPVDAKGGLSTLTVDNTQGGSDVHVKLCSVQREKCRAFRHVFIPLGHSFSMKDLKQGTYEIRYRSLANGAMAKSEPISLRQFNTPDGTRFSVITLTLYKVVQGNTQFTSLSETEF